VVSQDVGLIRQSAKECIQLNFILIGPS